MDAETIRKQTAYDLTIEYIRQSKMFNIPASDVDKRVEIIDEVYNNFYNALKNKNIINR